ncbi:MAG: YcaQ family DNA glycosylase [Chloroflexi bacterium]|nr:YcaQ family DNA glycosylase [Chloroflexota bacterium]
MDETRTIDRATARRFLVARHGLAPPRSLDGGLDGVRAAFGRLGSVQFDPLAVAGRNHDLVLHARVRDYRRAWTDALLYDTRELFEIWNKGLSLVPAPELPWYRVAWDSGASEHREGVLARSAATAEEVLARIRAEGPLSSLDFERRPAIDWWWGPTSEVRAVLEAMEASGIVGLARRDGNRKYYDLIERLYPPELLALRPSRHEQVRHKLYSRYRGHGLLGAVGPAELWYGTGKVRRTADMAPDDPVRGELVEEFVADGDLVPVRVEGVRKPRLVLGTELDLLDGSRRPFPSEPEVTFLAPLDPLVWDRDLLRELFDFDYLWEVYTPEHKRRWGYYVLPLLFGDRLVGRIEPRFDRATGTLRILGLWWEPDFDPRRADGFVPAMRRALAAYLRFGEVRTIDWAPHLGAARRLIGTRPRA